MARCNTASPDRKSTRLNSSHTVIYTLSYTTLFRSVRPDERSLPESAPHVHRRWLRPLEIGYHGALQHRLSRSEEHTSELQSHRDLHSFLHDALPICET